MKSSRSASTKNIRRNARRIVIESSDDSDSSVACDSARAEKVFSRRRLNSSNSDSTVTISSTNESIKLESNKTLFRISDTSSDLSVRDIKDENMVKEFNDTSSMKSIQSSTLNSTYSNSSIFQTIRKHKNMYVFSSDSSDESNNPSNGSDIEQETKLNSDSDSIDVINSSNEILSIPNKFNSKKSEIENELKNLSIIEPSDSDNDIDTSAHYKSTITSYKDNNLLFNDSKFLNQEQCNPLCQSSILENSDFEVMDNLSNKTNIEVLNLDDDKSTITSYKNNNLLFNDSKLLSQEECNPLCQSSILENSKFEVMDQLSNKTNIEVINLDDDDDDDSLSSEEFVPKQNPNTLTIDLTKNNSNKKTSTFSQGIPFNNSKKLSRSDTESLKTEKIRLKEIIIQLTKNIDTMKNTMKVTNLHLLPDGGFKLRNAISKEENALKDVYTQLKNVVTKLEYFGEETQVSPPNGKIKLLNNYNNGALTTKAAANIDINAMGDKALSTYRAQQALTLDVLHELHKSLDTCPSTNILANDPPELKVTLMPHQKYALEWLLWRERQNPRGGVLADDMGLGKTLTMISLILKSIEMKKIENDDSDTDDKLKNHNSKSIKGGTLIICPPSLISQWENEIKQKLRPRILNVVQHYGAGRNVSPRKLARNDVVITTYHVVMWDHKGRQRNDSPLFQIKWDRIILDEAHIIRNWKSQTSIAVSELSGIKRWVLTGTPVHNKETDFYALLKFIKCKPFDDWAVWKRWVGNQDEAGKNRLSLIVKTLMLRRTKNELSETNTFKLPPKNMLTLNIELFKEEKEAYEKVLLFSSSLFATYLYEKAEKENAIERGFPCKTKVKLHQQNLKDDVFKDHPELDKLFKQLKNNTDIKAHHILVLILRLRQLCCHPCLMKNILEDESLKVDGIQTEDIELVDHMSRMSIGIQIDEKKIQDSNSIFSDSWVSSKIKAVCDMVKDKVLNTDDKAVIVSQWPSMLILVNKQLSKYQVKTEMFSGSVPVQQRNKIIIDFNNSKGGPKILLLSLTAGGVGLNLVVANHIFLIDIHWNPQLEAQACDRVYRMGQIKPVYVYKFICTNTIEEKIQAIQLKKLEIADRLFGGNSEERTKITLNDLKDIFNINSNVK